MADGIEVRQVTIIDPQGDQHEVCWQEKTEAIAIRRLIKNVCALSNDSFYLVSMETGIPIACSSVLPDGSTFEVTYPSQEPKKEAESKKRGREDSENSTPTPKKKKYVQKKIATAVLSPQSILDKLNTARQITKNNLFKWCKALSFTATETDKAAVKWEMRQHIRESLGIDLKGKYKIGDKLKVFWDAAMGNDQKWYSGTIKTLNNTMANLTWNDGLGEDELNLMHLYVEELE